MVLKKTLNLLIINADDLGRDVSHNRGVAVCLAKGWCSSATIMANMPSTQDAFRIISKHGWHNRIGVHLNLTQGKALTKSIRQCQRFCLKDGTLVMRRSIRYWRLSSVEKLAVEKELRAQIRRCRGAGLPLTHADSHNHMHEEPGVLPIVIRVLKKEQIPYIRIARNIGLDRSQLNYIYRSLVNFFIEINGLRRTRRFGKADDYEFEINRNPNRFRSCEVMIHPALDESGRLVDSYLGMPIADGVNLWAGKTLSSYSSD